MPNGLFLVKRKPQRGDPPGRRRGPRWKSEVLEHSKGRGGGETLRSSSCRDGEGRRGKEGALEEELVGMGSRMSEAGCGHWISCQDVVSVSGYGYIQGAVGWGIYEQYRKNIGRRHNKSRKNVQEICLWVGII